MKNIMVFVLGAICGLLFGMGMLVGSGHMSAQTKNVTYYLETTQFDGFSFR